jgi:hypothetical protein
MLSYTAATSSGVHLPSVTAPTRSDRFLARSCLHECPTVFRQWRARYSGTTATLNFMEDVEYCGILENWLSTFLRLARCYRYLALALTGRYDDNEQESDIMSPNYYLLLHAYPVLHACRISFLSFFHDPLVPNRFSCLFYQQQWALRLSSASHHKPMIHHHHAWQFHYYIMISKNEERIQHNSILFPIHHD